MASNYPAGLDAHTTNFNDSSAMATNHAQAHNNVADAVNKIEAELGATPSPRLFFPIDRPIPPRPYALPGTTHGPTALGGGVVSVSSTASLLTEVANSTPRDIVIEAGTYTHTGALEIWYGHRLWARHVGQVELQYGIAAARPNVEIHGLKLNLSDEAKTLASSGIHTWNDGSGAGTGMKIYDCEIDCNHIVGHGIQMAEVTGAVVQRVKIREANWNGLTMMKQSQTNTDAITTITDVEVIEAYNASDPGSSNGTGEACFWIGHKVTNPVERLRGRLAGDILLWIANSCYDTTFRHIDLDDFPAAVPTGGAVGIYFEHKSRKIVVEKFRIGPTVRKGVEHEWHEGLDWRLNGVHTLPATTVTVRDTPITADTGLVPNSGTIYLGEWPSMYAFNYTSVTRATGVFTGTSNGTGKWADNTVVSPQQGGYAGSVDCTMSDGLIVCNRTGNPGGGLPKLGVSASTGSRMIRYKRVKIVADYGFYDDSGIPGATSSADSQLSIEDCDLTACGTQIQYTPLIQ